MTKGIKNKKEKTTRRAAIVVVNWNGFEDTSDCLRSVHDNSDQDHTVVLVDNGSTDREGERLKRVFPRIHLIRNEQNKGFSGGSNDGIRWAVSKGFKYIITLNNDCIVTKNWLSELISGLEECGADFASSKIMFFPEKGIINSDGDSLMPDGSALIVNWGRQRESVCGKRAIFSPCAAAAIYTAACLEDVEIYEGQYFDEFYFNYYEDIDLGIRLNCKKYRGISVPGAAVFHKCSASSGMVSSHKLFYSERNRLLNLFLNYPAPLIFAGEIFYLAKVYVLGCFSILRGAGKESPRYFPRIRVADFFQAFFTGHFFIIMNMGKILRKRRHRKIKGYIKWDIVARFSWNPFICKRAL